MSLYSSRSPTFLLSTNLRSFHLTLLRIPLSDDSLSATHSFTVYRQENQLAVSQSCNRLSFTIPTRSLLTHTQSTMAHHHHHLEKRDVSTIVSVIYVTAAPTFTGAIGGYITLDGDSSTVSAAANTAAGTPLQNTRAASSNGNGVAKGTPLQATRSPSSTAESAPSSSSSSGGAPSRQQRPSASTTSVSTATLVPSSASDAAQTSALSSSVVSVSYTHLTLPTKRIV